jgi:hypothetical protein
MKNRVLRGGASVVECSNFNKNTENIYYHSTAESRII